MSLRKAAHVCALTATALIAAGCSSSSDAVDQVAVDAPVAASSSADPDASGGNSFSCDGVTIETIGYAPYNNIGGYFPFVERGMKEAAEECGVEVVSFDPNADSARQVSGIQNLVSAGAGAIVLIPVDPKAVAPVVKSLNEQDVAVIAVATQIDGSDVTFNLDDKAFGNVEGTSAGNWLKENRKDSKPKIAILHQDSGGAPLLDRHAGVVEGLDETLGAGSYELVAEVEAFVEDEANAATTTILQANPDIDLIVGLNDASALGALSAIKALGKVPGKDIAVVTGGDDARVVNGVLAGEVVSTVGLFPIDQGRSFARAAMRLSAGDDVEASQIVPNVLITSDNAQEVLDQQK